MRKLILLFVYLVMLGMLGTMNNVLAANDILKVQQLLHELGYDPGVIDGAWGGKTRDALKNFQADQSMTVNGRVDAKIIQILQQRVIAAKSPTNTPAVHVDTQVLLAPSPLPSLLPTPTLKPQQAEKPKQVIETKPVIPNNTNSIPQEPAKGLSPNADITSQSRAIIETSLGIKFRKIPGGCFKMGGNDADNMPIHAVCVHKQGSFLISQYEITQQQWQMITNYNPAVNNLGGFYPVENVSWNEVQLFIIQLNAKGQGRYRLPTEAEWEYSAGAGNNSPYWWGYADPVCISKDAKGANFNGNGAACAKNTVSVGNYQENPFGLYDVHGNVAEWVEDAYKPGYDASSKDDPLVELVASKERVFRGGSWLDKAADLRVFHRQHALSTFRAANLGFRLIYEP